MAQAGITNWLDLTFVGSRQTVLGGKAFREETRMTPEGNSLKRRFPTPLR